MLPFFREDSHKKSPCKIFSLNIIFDQRFLTHQSGKLLVCDAVFGLYMLDLEKVGESPETSFEGLLITDDNDDDDNDDDQEVEENRIRPSQQLERVEYTQLLPPNLEVEGKIHKV